MPHTIAQIALYAALTASLGLLPKFALPIAGGIPITAQSLAVMLAGVILGARRGGLALMLFLLLVAAGLPLLAGGRGGLAVFAAPSAGFVLSFPVAAFCSGLLMQQLQRLPVFVAALLSALFGGILVLYAGGILGMALLLDKTLLQAALVSFVFLPGDLIKAFLAAWLAQQVFRANPAAMPSWRPAAR